MIWSMKTAPDRLINYTAKQIEERFTFKLDAWGETFDRYTGVVQHKEFPEVRFRVKIMKTGDVRESFSAGPGHYRDPKLNKGRAQAVKNLQAR